MTGDSDTCDHYWSMGEAMAVDTCTKCGAWRDQYTRVITLPERETV